MEAPQAKQPSPPAKFAQALIGLGILLALGVVGFVGMAHGARWLGLTHFGGIVEEVELDLKVWTPDTPGINAWAHVEESRGNDRYQRGQLMAWVRIGDQTVATYLSRDGLGGGGERVRVGLWRREVSPTAAAMLKGVSSVTIHVEEVEFPKSGGLKPIKELGNFVVPVAP